VPEEAVTILHISDLHVGEFFAFDSEEAFISNFKKATQRVAREFPLFVPRYMLCAGDLTSTGKYTEMQKAVSLLKVMAQTLKIPLSRVIVCPGNHDIDWDETKKHKKELTEHRLHCVDKIAVFLDAIRELHDTKLSSVVKPLPKSTETTNLADTFSIHYFNEDTLLICSLNSTIAESHREEDHYGYVGEHQVIRVDEFFERNDHVVLQNKLQGAFKIVLIHHPFLSPANGNGSALRDPIYFENWLRDKHIDLVLHGHQHYYKTTGFQELPQGYIAVGAGSIGLTHSKREDAYLSLNISSVRLRLMKSL